MRFPLPLTSRHPSKPRTPEGVGSHERKPPSKNDADARLDKLSRGVLVSTFVAVSSVGFGVVSAVNAQMQVDMVTGNMKSTVVASQTIESGTTITSDQVSLVEIPGTYLSGNSSADLSAFIGKTASVTIPVNTQMSSNLIADLGNTSSLAARIPTGQRAVTVNVTSSSGLSSLLRCGDKVQAYATARNGSIYLIASSIPVLALDDALSGSTAKGSYSTVTLQVTDTEAEEIIAAEQDGSITLVLNPMAEHR